MEQRICPACCKTFTPTHWAQKACPPTDADRARQKGQARSRCAKKIENAKHRGRPLVVGDVGQTFDCAQCGTRCTPGENVAPHATRFCGQDCKYAWHHQPKPPPTRRECALLALAAAATGGSSGRLWVEGPCIVCEERYLRPCRATDHGYCSRKCMKQATRPAARRRYRAKHGHSRHRDRARRYGVAYEHISPTTIFDRDGYRCGICGQDTQPDAKVPHPRAPTIDHIIPMSRGGSHTHANVQCACFECNWQKSDTLIAAAA